MVDREKNTQGKGEEEAEQMQQADIYVDFSSNSGGEIKIRSDAGDVITPIRHGLLVNRSKAGLSMMYIQA